MGIQTQNSNKTDGKSRPKADKQTKKTRKRASPLREGDRSGTTLTEARGRQVTRLRWWGFPYRRSFTKSRARKSHHLRGGSFLNLPLFPQPDRAAFLFSEICFYCITPERYASSKSPRSSMRSRMRLPSSVSRTSKRRLIISNTTSVVARISLFSRMAAVLPSNEP